MAGWVLWLIAACVLALAGALIGRIFFRPWAVGAGFAAVLALGGGGTVVTWVGFLLGSFLAGFVMRIAGRSRRRRSSQEPTGPEPLVGKRGVVLEQIANRYGIGCIELDGEVWTARAYDRDRVIDAGAQVTVVEVRGATALVRTDGGGATALVSD